MKLFSLILFILFTTPSVFGQIKDNLSIVWYEVDLKKDSLAMFWKDADGNKFVVVEGRIAMFGFHGIVAKESALAAHFEVFKVKCQFVGLCDPFVG